MKNSIEKITDLGKSHRPLVKNQRHEQNITYIGVIVLNSNRYSCFIQLTSTDLTEP